jgi:hypothetical protein
MTSLLNFIKIYQLVQKLLGGTERHAGDLISLTFLFRKVGSKPEGKTQFDRPRCRWEDNIKMDLEETVCEDVYWIHLSQYRVQWWARVNIIMNH